MYTANINSRNYVMVSTNEIMDALDYINAAVELKIISIQDALATSIFGSSYIDNNGIRQYILKDNVIIDDEDDDIELPF